MIDREREVGGVVRLARVAHVHPEGQKIEVVFLDNGDIGRDVQVMSPMAGTDFGFTSGIPAPEQEGYEENTAALDPDRRDITAVVATVQGRYICLGFVYPQVTQMAFTKTGDPDRMILRTPSDWHLTVSKNGDMDMEHPSGAFIRIGVGEEPDRLDGRDFDGRWMKKHNADGAANIVLGVSSPNPGGGSSRIILRPDGTILIEASDSITTRAPVIIEETPTHLTTGLHTDAKGTHCKKCS